MSSCNRSTVARVVNEFPHVHVTCVSYRAEDANRVFMGKFVNVAVFNFKERDSISQRTALRKRAKLGALRSVNAKWFIGQFRFGIGPNWQLGIQVHRRTVH